MITELYVPSLNEVNPEAGEPVDNTKFLEKIVNANDLIIQTLYFNEIRDDIEKLKADNDLDIILYKIEGLGAGAGISEIGAAYTIYGRQFFEFVLMSIASQVVQELAKPGINKSKQLLGVVFKKQVQDDYVNKPMHTIVFKNNVQLEFEFPFYLEQEEVATAFTEMAKLCIELDKTLSNSDEGAIEFTFNNGGRRWEQVLNTTDRE